MIHTIWSTSFDDIVSRTGKKSDSRKHKSNEDYSATRKHSLGSDSYSSNKSEKLSMKDRFQITIKKFWHNRTFIRSPWTQLL